MYDSHSDRRTVRVTAPCEYSTCRVVRLDLERPSVGPRYRSIPKEIDLDCFSDVVRARWVVDESCRTDRSCVVVTTMLWSSPAAVVVMPVTMDETGRVFAEIERDVQAFSARRRRMVSQKR